jgi:integrase
VEARAEADKIKAAAKQGLLPGEIAKVEQENELLAATVRQFGARYMREIVCVYRKDPESMNRYLERDVYPTVGDKPVASVKLYDLRCLIFNHRDEGHPQAALALRDLLKRMWDYAVVSGIVASNPLQALHRKFIAKSASRSRSLSPVEVGEFMNSVADSRARTMVKAAFQLILLTLTRKTEMLLARWEHIDVAKNEWIIPPEHSKNKKQHVVYLSVQAKRLFVDLAKRHYGGNPNPKHFVIHASGSRTQPLAESTLNRALSRIAIGMQEFTVHDLRRTAATLLSENDYQADVIEKALNHTMKGVRGVYNRAQYRDQRRRMLQDWADKVEDLTIEARAHRGKEC